MSTAADPGRQPAVAVLLAVDVGQPRPVRPGAVRTTTTPSGAAGPITRGRTP